ncbi:Sel1 repeat-containing protein, partial [Pseudomonas syringae pv. actinidiae ICMP 19099]
MRALLACSIILTYIALAPESNAMPHVTKQEQIDDKLAFECHHEADILNIVNQEADTLYKYGLFIQQKDGPKDFNEAARYYRIAAAHNHYKAATNLQMLITQGLANSPSGQKEAIALVEKFMTLGVPGAYYDMAHYLEAGYGVEQSQEKANAYFRKAADLGSPDAQYYVATLLGRIKGGAVVMEQMQRCAASQGNASAARELAGYLRVGKKYDEAVVIYHQGTKSGDFYSARRLSKAFEGPSSPEDLYYMQLKTDNERSNRYLAISKFLQKNEQLGPKLPDIDSIVP